MQSQKEFDHVELRDLVEPIGITDRLRAWLMLASYTHTLSLAKQHISAKKKPFRRRAFFNPE